MTDDETKKALPEIPDLQTFLFKTPLYEDFAFPEYDDWIGSNAYSLLGVKFRSDGYCPLCERDVTFIATESSVVDAQSFSTQRVPFGTVTDGIHKRRIVCLRNPGHAFDFFFKLKDDVFTKIGQTPSLADFALAELKDYRALLKGENGRELYRAIGLAAHGVGIGSFVYLRRVFERLIFRAFENGRAQHGWSEDEFQKKRTSERISMVADELPEFLVEHASIYGILSKGVHELTEEECLQYFEPLRAAIMLILEQEREKARKEEMKAQLSKAVKGMAPSSPK